MVCSVLYPALRMQLTHRAMLADCHTHLDQYAAEEIPAILERAQAAGVGLVIAAGSTLDSSRACVALAQQHPIVYAGVGMHPMDLSGPVDETTYAELARLASPASCGKVMVISEVGLDYMEGCPPRQLQEQVFRAHIRLALELELPIVFHTREAAEDTLRLLREEGAQRVGGAWHYFQGEETLAQEAMDMGFFISLAKPLLRLPQLQEVASRLPLDRIVLETDAYPQPWKRRRTNWTEPKDVRAVAEKLAELRGISLEEVASATTANLSRMLGSAQTHIFPR